MTTPLIPTPHLLRAANLPAPSTVRLRNLHTTVRGPRDAWDRPPQPTTPPQPLSVSAAVSLAAPSAVSSGSDAVVPGDTVHYGLLGRAILERVRVVTDAAAAATTTAVSDDDDDDTRCSSLRGVLERLWVDLTGSDIRGGRRRRQQHTTTTTTTTQKLPFLHAAPLRALEVQLALPKATLLGDAVRLTATGGFERRDDGGGVGRYVQTRSALALRIERLRVPTLIGVNDNERLARQLVVATVEVDMLDHERDLYPQLEQVIVKTMSESSYETLEALASRITAVVAEHLAATKRQDPESSPSDSSAWHIHVSLEKPVAVPSADAVCVELSTSTADLPGRQDVS